MAAKTGKTSRRSGSRSRRSTGTAARRSRTGVKRTRSTAPAGKRAAAATSGRIRARGSQSGRTAALTEVHEAINSAVAEGAKVRRAIESRIDSALRKAGKLPRAGGRSRRK